MAQINTSTSSCTFTVFTVPDRRGPESEPRVAAGSPFLSDNKQTHSHNKYSVNKYDSLLSTPPSGHTANQQLQGTRWQAGPAFLDRTGGSLVPLAERRSGTFSVSVTNLKVFLTQC